MFSGSVTGRGRGSGRQSVLYYWLIPDRNTEQHIGIAVLARRCVYCIKGLECGSNGRIIFGVICTGLLGLVLVSCEVIPSAV